LLLLSSTFLSLLLSGCICQLWPLVEAPWQSLVFIYSVGRSRRTAISQALIAVGMSYNV
jgi:hypothetical protein